MYIVKEEEKEGSPLSKKKKYSPSKRNHPFSSYSSPKEKFINHSLPFTFYPSWVNYYLAIKELFVPMLITSARNELFAREFYFSKWSLGFKSKRCHGLSLENEKGSIIEMVFVIISPPKRKLLRKSYMLTPRTIKWGNLLFFSTSHLVYYFQWH